MDVVKVERMDHLGIIAGVIQDLGIIEMIDSRIATDEREEIMGFLHNPAKRYISEIRSWNDHEFRPVIT